MSSEEDEIGALIDQLDRLCFDRIEKLGDANSRLRRSRSLSRSIMEVTQDMNRDLDEIIPDIIHIIDDLIALIDDEQPRSTGTAEGMNIIHKLRILKNMKEQSIKLVNVLPFYIDQLKVKSFDGLTHTYNEINEIIVRYYEKIRSQLTSISDTYDEDDSESPDMKLSRMNASISKIYEELELLSVDLRELEDQLM